MATDIEKMIIAASRLLPKEGAVYVGTGMPLLASVLALKTHSPDLLLVYEGGGVGGKPTGRLPIQVSESLTYENGVIAGSMDYVMNLAQAGWIQYGFLGGAQIDVYGNLNTTVIGDWEQPKVRLPGSGGGADIASFCEKNYHYASRSAKICKKTRLFNKSWLLFRSWRTGKTRSACQYRTISCYYTNWCIWVSSRNKTNDLIGALYRKNH